MGSLTQSFAHARALDGILVNSVAPAGFATDRAKELGFLPALAKANPLGRAAEPVEIAEWIVMMAVARKRGHLVFVGSSSGRFPHPNAAVYGASKAGLSLFCDALRCDFLGTGVRVTEVVPGRVGTQLYRTALGNAAQSQLYDGYASIRPDDIAAVMATAVSLPPHVDVSRLEVFPTDQAVGGARFVKSS